MIPADNNAPVSERFTAEGACGGEYAIVWDRERKQIVFPYLRTGASVSDDQIRAVADELNKLLSDALRKEGERVRRETLMERFQGHRLLGLQCEAGKTDALCECGWMYAANSVGGAFDYWVEHLIWVQNQQRVVEERHG